MTPEEKRQRKADREVLSLVTASLRHAVRAYPHGCSIGGDEFSRHEIAAAVRALARKGVK